MTFSIDKTGLKRGRVSEYDLTQRPDPANFRPQDFKRIEAVHSRFQSNFPRTEPRAVVPSTSMVWDRRGTPVFPSKGLVGDLLDRLSDKIVGTSSVRETYEMDEIKKAELARATLWGTVAGWCFAEAPALLLSSLETLIDPIRYAMGLEVVFAEYARKLRGPDVSGSTGETLVLPELPARAVARSALIGEVYFSAHISQVLREVSSDLGDSPADLASAAPVIDGLVACHLHQALTVNGVPGVNIDTDWEMDAGSNWGAFDNVEGSIGFVMSKRIRQYATARETPLVEPSTARDVMHAALWANLAAKDYGEVIEAVMSLGGDTVATAAAAGAVAACQFGVEAIPKAFRARVPAPAMLEQLAAACITRFIA